MGHAVRPFARTRRGAVGAVGAEFEAGMVRMREAASAAPDEPLVDRLDLLVLR
jgi:hypothetical protein